VSRQAVYQYKTRLEKRHEALNPVKKFILRWRRFMPRIGTRKLYHLIKPALCDAQIKLGRDGLFAYLRNENL